MADGWSDFNHPRPIQRLQRVPPSKDQVTGLTIAGSVLPAPIDADFQPDPLNDEDRQPGGLIEEGDAVLFTAAGLKVKELVRVHSDDAGTYTTWRVKGTIDDYDWLHTTEGDPERIIEYVLEKWEET